MTPAKAPITCVARGTPTRRLNRDFGNRIRLWTTYAIPTSAADQIVSPPAVRTSMGFMAVRSMAAAFLADFHTPALHNVGGSLDWRATAFELASAASKSKEADQCKLFIRPRSACVMRPRRDRAYNESVAWPALFSALSIPRSP